MKVVFSPSRKDGQINFWATSVDAVFLVTFIRDIVVDVINIAEDLHKWNLVLNTFCAFVFAFCLFYDIWIGFKHGKQLDKEERAWF